MIRGIFFIDSDAGSGLPLLLLITFNVVIAIGMYAYLRKNKKNKKLPDETIFNLGILGLSWLASAIVWGLILTFDVLEASGNTFVLKAFIAGFEVAMKIMMSGLLLICLPLSLYLRFGTARRERSV